MLYLIGGENLFESSERISNIKESSEKDNEEIKIYNADEVLDIRNALGEVDSFSFLSKKRLVIIKRILSTNANTRQVAADFLEKNGNYNIVFWEDKNIDKRSKIYKIIKKVGIVEEYPLLTYQKLKSWIQQYSRTKFNLDNSSADLLITKIGNDQMQIKNIIDNLFILLKSEGKTQISVEDIEKLVDKTSEESIWEFLDSLTKRDKGKALLVMEDLLRVESDFAVIVSMIARQLRILSLVKILMESGSSVFEIISKLRLHPFVARKIAYDCDKFSLKEIKKLYEKLVKLDLVVKEGRFDAKLALDLFIAAI